MAKIISIQTIGYIQIVIAGTLWGSIGFFVSILEGMGAGSPLISFMRIFTATVILIPIMLVMGGKAIFKADKKTILSCLAMGLFSQAMFNYSYSEAINNVGVATGAVLLYTAPIFVCVMSRIIFKELMGPIKVVAVIINIIGCALTVTGGDLSTVKFSVYGMLMGVAAGFLYGLMTIISKTLSGHNHPLTIVFYQFLFGSIALALFTQPFGNLVTVWSTKFALTAIGYGLIPTVGAYFFYMKGLAKNIETSKVPVIASVETVVAAVIGVVLFSENLGIIKALGIILVLASIAIMNLFGNEVLGKVEQEKK